MLRAVFTRDGHVAAVIEGLFECLRGVLLRVARSRNPSLQLLVLETRRRLPANRIGIRASLKLRPLIAGLLSFGTRDLHKSRRRVHRA